MFDPDNGLEEQTERHTATGPKFLYLDESEPFARRGQSLVIYQHAGRNGSVRAQMDRARGRVSAVIGNDVKAVRFTHGPSRLFLVAPTATHASVLYERVGRLLDGPWKAAFV